MAQVGQPRTSIASPDAYLIFTCCCLITCSPTGPYKVGNNRPTLPPLSGKSYRNPPEAPHQQQWRFHRVRPQYRRQGQLCQHVRRHQDRTSCYQEFSPGHRSSRLRRSRFSFPFCCCFDYNTKVRKNYGLTRSVAQAWQPQPPTCRVLVG